MPSDHILSVFKTISLQQWQICIKSRGALLLAGWTNRQSWPISKQRKRIIIRSEVGSARWFAGLEGLCSQFVKPHRRECAWAGFEHPYSISRRLWKYLVLFTRCRMIRHKHSYRYNMLDETKGTVAWDWWYRLSLARSARGRRLVGATASLDSPI